MKKLVFAILVGNPFLLWAQPSVDSLKSLLILKNALKETARIQILNELAYQIRASDPGVSLTYAREALAAAQKINDKPGEGKALLTIVDHYWAATSYAKGLESGLQALRILEAIPDKQGIMNAYYLLGLTYGELKDTLKRDDYYKRAFALAKELKHNEMFAKLYNVQGIIAANRNPENRDPRKGLPFYLKALSSIGTDNKAHVKVYILGNIGAVYDDEKNFDGEKAFRYMNEALSLARRQNNKWGEANAHLHLGCAYKTINEMALAEEHLKKAEQLARQTEARRILLSTYISFIDIKFKTGNSKQAHEYQKKYAWARDSIFNADRAQQIAELETRFGSEKKQQAIELLENEKRIQVIWRNVLIIGVLFTALASFFIVRLQLSRTRKTKQLLEVQRLLNERLKDMDKLKTQFFTTVSHEFRTPLTLIMAPVENELKKKSSPEGRESLLLIRRNANRLLELVNQLLDLSKLESGKMGLHVQQSDISQFLSVMAASFDSLAQHKQVEFIKNLYITEGQYWYDQDKVEKIISNLLANAFKNTPPGGMVKIEIDMLDASVLSIAVSDTGAGIPEDEQAHVFSPFYQTRQAVANHEPGTGLGLSLVRELVKLYNGTITLQSSPGAGTTFAVTIPVNKKSFTPDQIFEDGSGLCIPLPVQPLASEKRTVQGRLASVNPDALQDCKDSVLIVEDNADMREYMSSVLQNNDYAVMAASNGEEALQLTLKFVPSLVLSDLMMPKMDGLELTKRMKKDERTSHIPIILLTAKSEQQSRLEGLKTGADDYLTKPFSPDELLVRIGNLIKQRKKLHEKFRERILVTATPISEISLDDKFLNKARGVVESNLSDYTFTVEKMANEMNLSRTQLLRKLKALTGLSPNDFIKRIRLKRAADMIHQKADTITQIGYAVGFNDQSYFTKCFKKEFGVTPTEFSMQAVNNDTLLQ